MREILRLSITLAVIAILSASLLTGMESITEPIIQERRQEEFLKTLQDFFPGVEDYETEEIEGDSYNIIYDSEDEKIGIMVTVRTTGYEGAIHYNLAVDREGEIIGIRIISHSETPGIGDVITTDGFQEQFIGKSYEDSIEAGEDVDIVSGATESTGAMINSISRVVNTIAEYFLGQGGESIDFSAIPDGIYRGSVDGTEGMLTVEVEIVSGTMERIDILEQNETDTYFIEAYPLVPELIIVKQSLDIDTRTGATLSSERIISAVKSALPDPSGNHGGDGLSE